MLASASTVTPLNLIKSQLMVYVTKPAALQASLNVNVTTNASTRTTAVQTNAAYAVQQQLVPALVTGTKKWEWVATGSHRV
jgi:hypothetical protein